MNEKPSPWQPSPDRLEFQSKIEKQERITQNILSEIHRLLNEYIKQKDWDGECQKTNKTCFVTLWYSDEITNQNNPRLEEATSYIDDLVSKANKILEKEKLPFLLSVTQDRLKPELLDIKLIKI